MKKNADQLAELGERLLLGGYAAVIFLHPSQEWMAVVAQMPFVRMHMVPR